MSPKTKTIMETVYVAKVGITQKESPSFCSGTAIFIIDRNLQ